jgi:hypothetical protein
MRASENLDADALVERVEFGFKFVGHLNGPFHWNSMTPTTYEVHYILAPSPGQVAYAVTRKQQQAAAQRVFVFDARLHLA